MMRRALRIGITIGLHAPDQDLWTNGILQNAIYLARTLRNSPLRHDVVLLNTTETPPASDAVWNASGCSAVVIASHKEPLDVVIELGGQISGDQTRLFHEQGAKVVSYCCGAEYVQTMEAIIFGRPTSGGMFLNLDYDAIWIIPQIAKLNAHFFQTLRRVPVQEVPFVWDPVCIEQACRTIPDGGVYLPVDAPKRISILEPNINVAKFCLYPILIVEEVFRENPEKISYLHVANSKNFAEKSPLFETLMLNLDIVNSRKASFIERVVSPIFLKEFTDVVVSHQWGLPLNYAYLECCWQGYPLVHNAELISDLGFYYPDHDVVAGAKMLAGVLSRPCGDWAGWRAEQRKGISRFLPSNPQVIAAYDDLLFGLVSSARPTLPVICENTDAA